MTDNARVSGAACFPHALSVVKGHGTGNDFVVLPDLKGSLSLSPGLVRALCDRHSGLGADGVLRVVRTEYATEPDVRALADGAPYFMDYHNADGSIAEMCGNGVRVFARYLQRAGLASGPLTVATRGGSREVWFDGDAITVDMGQPTLRREKPSVRAQGLDGPRPGVALDLPNPHVVVELSDESELDGLDLSRAPVVDPALPEGQNVEFVVRTGASALRMRVHERGVGETQSCGTGICAAVVVTAAAAPAALASDAPSQGAWTVDVPGGRCEVSWSSSGSVLLSGPAVLVADAELDGAWLAEHR